MTRGPSWIHVRAPPGTATAALVAAVCLLSLAGAAPDDRLLVSCGTTKGTIRIELRPSWAPTGVDRFVQLIEDGYFDDSAFYRNVEGFVTQFGIAAERRMSDKWDGEGAIRDEDRRPATNAKQGPVPPTTFPRGGISFAGSGPHTRSTQLFIASRDGVINSADAHASQIGTVVDG